MFLRRLYNYFFGPVDIAPLRYSEVPQQPIKPIDTSLHQQQSKPITKKRDPIPLQVRNTVWETYHGIKQIGTCYCCGIPIERYHGGWHCSHVVAHHKQGPTTVDNLRTCCRKCNLSMGDQNLYTYIQEKKLTGPGSKNATRYLKQHPSQIFDVRTNNWNRT
jgi:5-methylcytosine-specific restriction endonuclease McrA